MVTHFSYSGAYLEELSEALFFNYGVFVRENCTL